MKLSLENKKVRMFGYVVGPLAVAALGYNLIVGTLAASTFASTEPETASLSPGASIGAVSTASGGQFLQLNTTTTTATAAAGTSRFPGDPNPLVTGKSFFGASGTHIAAHEAAAGGKSIAIHREFSRTWGGDTKLINSAKDDKLHNRLPWLSTKTLGWAEMASGRHDGEIDTELRAFDAIGTPIWFTVWHEPENDVPAAGTPADWRAMQIKFRQRMTAIGTKNIAFMPIVMSYTWSPSSGRTPDDWWVPGIWDAFGVDHYAPTIATAPVNAPYLSFVSWVQAKGLPYAIGEWGQRGSDAAAVSEMQAWWDYGFNNKKDLVGMSYFDSGLNSPGGTWELFNGPLNWFDNVLATDNRIMRVNALGTGTGGGTTTVGSANTSLNVPISGPLKVWSRIMAADTTNNKYSLQIDSQTASTVGGTAATPGTWTWITLPNTISLTAGTHTVKLTAVGTGVKVDRVMLLSDVNCAPIGTGTNCESSTDSVKPTATVTAPSAGATVSGTTTLTATASDNIAVAKVDFIVDGRTVGTDATSPYTFAWNSAILANGTHTLTARAYDTSNLTGDSAAVSIVLKNGDIVAPSSPLGLRSNAQTANSISLVWSASTDNIAVTGYKVFRNGVVLGTVPTPAFTDTGLTANTSYSYRASAVDASYNQSAQSAAIVATTKSSGDTSSPSIPTNVLAAGLSYNPITVSWTSSTDNVGVTKYIVERNNVSLAEVNNVSNNYADTTALPNSTYTYSVRAADAAGNTSAAGTATPITTPNPTDTIAPSTPTNLGATVVSGSQINLTWSPSTDNIAVAGYNIYRNDVRIGFLRSDGTTSNLQYGDATVSPNTTYSYKVQAYDGSNLNSAFSTSVSVTTQSQSNTITNKNGVWAEYFANATLAGLPVASMEESNINYNWSGNAPLSGVPADNFSARWTGRIEPTTTGTYTIYTKADDGVRLFLDDKMVVDDWVTHSAHETAYSVKFTAGSKHNFRYEYFEQNGDALAQLLWSGPGITKQAIANSYLAPQQYGLHGEYYADQALTKFVTSRTDASVNFDWAAGAPFGSIQPDHFSARWTGQVYAPTTADYTFFTRTDDGARLSVNGVQVINDWTTHGVKENSATVSLVGGQKYNLSLEYFEEDGLATANLEWSTPTMARQVIDATNLRDRW